MPYFYQKSIGSVSLLAKCYSYGLSNESLYIKMFLKFNRVKQFEKVGKYDGGDSVCSGRPQHARIRVSAHLYDHPSCLPSL